MKITASRLGTPRATAWTAPTRAKGLASKKKIRTPFEPRGLQKNNMGGYRRMGEQVEEILRSIRRQRTKAQLQSARRPKKLQLKAGGRLCTAWGRTSSKTTRQAAKAKRKRIKTHPKGQWSKRGANLKPCPRKRSRGRLQLDTNN